MIVQGRPSRSPRYGECVRADRFFVWVWRLNGLLVLALVVLVGAAVAAFNSALFWRPAVTAMQ